MGCNIYWEGVQPDIEKQRQCSLFLNAYFEYAKMGYEVYNGAVKGKFILFQNEEFFYDDGILPSQNDIKIVDELDLIGISGCFWEKEKFSVYFKNRSIARRQWSFVFINADIPPLFSKGTIVTIETFNSFENERYEQYKELLSAEDIANNGLFGIVRQGGMERVFSDEAFKYADLIYFLKKLFLPDIDTADQHSHFDWLEKNVETRKMYQEGLSKNSVMDAIENLWPGAKKEYFTDELKSFWKTDFDKKI